MKKQLLRVLAVTLTVILLLTCITSAVYGQWGVQVEELLEMTAYSEAGHACGPSSGVSIGRYYRDEVDIDGDEGDVIIEEFEWGDNGTSLDTSGGEVEWTLNKIGWGGSPVAEISTDYAHLGDRSARFYRDSGYMQSYIQASYLQDPPTWRKFYFYFEEDSDAVLYTTNGDGDNRIYVRVSRDEGMSWLVEYYDGDDWNEYEIYYPPFVENTWHCLEFRSIDWVHATYDIRFDGATYVVEAHMAEYSGYNGMTAYYNAGGLGSECWIDDILDTRTGADYYYLPDDDDTFDRLYDCMGTAGDYPAGGTNPSNYGPGFAEMTLDPDGYPDIDDGYDNFGYVHDETVDDMTEFWDIVNAIDNGWPVALCGNFKNVDEISGSDPSGDWPPDKDHYIAIKGYGYYKFMSTITYSHYIICTDSYCGADELKLNWNNLINNGLRLETITIRDDVIENFEWGSDTVSLGTDGGDVDWTVSASGSSYAQIDDDMSHLGTRSAKIYRDGTNTVQAYYPCSHADYLGFYVRKDNNSFFYFDHGDGSTRIIVRITSGEIIEYYDTAYRTIGDPISTYTWYLLEFRNIDWDAKTYDIYLNGNSIKTGAAMQSYPYAGGIARFSNSYTGNTGSFWVDAIFE